MLRINATAARVNLNNLIGAVSASHEPVVTTGKR